MRIQSQREIFAFRIRAFDWRPTKWDDVADTDYNRHTAPLENGHELQAWSWNDRPDMGWSWAVHTPGENPRSYHDDNWPAGGGMGSASRPHWEDGGVLDEQTAKQRAEGAYQKLFPIGQSTGGHDSGVDYSDLNSFKS